jgi:carbohydrate diacid regulator
MKISHALAQEIVNKVMKVIPYNVNIMNEVGLIIGSGDPARIGSYHQGAIAAIEQGTIVTVYSTEGGAKPGVNIPIHFRNRIIGVIGISGDPEIVSPFAELVRVTGELLVNQEFLFKERRIKEQMKEEFLYQWVFRNEDYDTAFIDNGETLGITLGLSRKAVIVKGSMEKETLLLDHQEFMLRLNTNTILFIAPESSDILKRITIHLGTNFEKVGVGGSYTHIAKSVQEAKRAIEISEKLELKEKKCYYRNLRFFDYLTNRDIAYSDLNEFYNGLDQNPKGIELLETLVSFIENSGDMNAISKELHIHRNSLAYRLQKIEQLSNRNPKKTIDLFQLFTGYIQYRMKNS